MKGKSDGENENDTRIPEDEQCAYILEKISNLYFNMNKYYKSIDCLEHSLNIYSSLNQFSEIERVRLKLYQICQEDNRKDASLFYAEEICKF